MFGRPHTKPPSVPPRYETRRRRRSFGVIRVTVIASALVALTVILFVFDPTATHWMPQCPSHYLTGYDCPGCGTLRAIHAILHGDIAAAWHFNAALFFAVPLIIALALAPHTRVGSPLRRFADSRWTPLTVLLLLIAWTILRNLPCA